MRCRPGWSCLNIKTLRPKRITGKCFIISLFTFLVVLIVSFLQNETNVKKLKREKSSNMFQRIHIKEKTKRFKLILIWEMPENVNYPKSLDERCGLCHMTENRSLASASDSIVIHFRRMSTLPDKITRNSNQLYVWLCRESPATTRDLYNANLKRFDNYFNLSMTYRRDSGIFYPYAEKLQDYKLTNQDPFITFYLKYSEILMQKRHLAIAVISNCKVTGGAARRYDYIENLIKAKLDIDLYGKCYLQFPPRWSPEATFKISQYKFYFALENSQNCRDYITEKFWFNALYSGAVPVVWGTPSNDLKALAPKHSYIDVNDFESPEDLVEYLNYLNKNDDAYMEYFDWRRALSNLTEYPRKVFSNVAFTGYCALCRELHINSRERSSISSLQSWWYETENPHCQ